MQQPKLIDLPEMKIAGLGTKFISVLSPDKNNSSVIPKLWHDFVARQDEITNKKGKGALGVVECLPNTIGKPQGPELFYIACVEVADLNSIPAAMISRVIPAGRHALFTHVGKLDKLDATMKFIHGVWLPQSGMSRRDAPEIEVYDERFNPNSDQSEFDILLPVR